MRRDVSLRDLNLPHVSPSDDRCIEVIVVGLPLFHGAQLVVDTILVALLKRNGQPRPRAVDTDGAACVAARRKKAQTYPELSGEQGRARLSSYLWKLEAVGRLSMGFVRCPARARAREEPNLFSEKGASQMS